MKPAFTLLRTVPNVNFLGLRQASLGLSAVLVLGSILATLLVGLNFGIDFRGGTLIEIRTTQGPAELGSLRAEMGGLGLGEVALQEFGAPTDVLMRVQQQPGDAEGQQAALATVRDALDRLYGADGYEIRRTEFVGPTVGQELIEAGIWAVTLALGAIMLYIWFRFEWQFGLCAVIALVHDIVTTIGLFALIQHEFNLATVAALLTIAGYSINDTVVVFDRVRETLRKYKKLPVPELLNRALNETLSRTLMTSITTLIALAALYVLGGAIIADFALALIWGVLIGTYSSIFLAVPLLSFLELRAQARDEDASEGGVEPA